ncbi:t-snare protein [Glarea lozoyensis ATCC 20868]|uniref:t-SNARE affecting a late Golgi compartment protein 1 n=1 Tax=Glarea lozoyensis (strain ATCC 20868 / MF5171) TaxID=1116229 RepID=S3CEF3_GLAL2|nr:t-snare protein [Glarea lozoyensis ATCC 20868]EPE24852.1 t-snare protein [Glarea lozoyensis ATCC 20868]
MMNSTNEEDPFLQVQSEVLQTLSSTRPLFTSYLRIRSLTSNTTNPELLSTARDLSDSIVTLSEDISDLRASVAAVQSDPYKYGLEIEEVSRRQRFVEEISNEVDDMQEELSKGSSGRPGIVGRSESGKGRVYDSPPQEREDYNAEFEQQQQLTMMAEQDQTLDSVYVTVGNLRQQANVMGRELAEQEEMLHETDTLTDRVGGRLQYGLKTMGTVIKKNEDGLIMFMRASNMGIGANYTGH